ncbi:autotransporter domain-containing protein [Phyllobacterium myrsinacearum]|uniref:Subtilase-type serine protease n=1 Tax=Phyllobacterium myrsinacearum TaxID=28101 RepID=A0A839EL74_9HYPH|nr:autotransporter serine protease [Phyllobacterium myrsinacearum]MBA8878975.1 subtilase-type serine protease [Phyllobacterium myrsinacearum]
MAQSAGDPTNPETWYTPEFQAQWGLSYIYANYAYAMGVDGSGVKVGVIDSGLAKDHPEFTGRYEEGITVQPDKPWDVDSNSVTHGSAVAGIIAANRDGKGMHGVAPGATIVAVNAEAEDGYVSTEASLAGIYGLVSRDVHIINNSYGSESAITDYPPDVVYSMYQADIAAYKHAVDNDTLMIWGSGNDSRGQPTIESAIPYLIPELERGWLAVTGYDYQYGNHCGVAKNWCLAAPAEFIFTVDGNGGYQRIAGTSFAAPHVAGVAALVKQMFPYMTMDQVRQVLLGTAIDIGDPGIDDVYGYGLLDAGGAVLGPGKFDWGDFNVKLDGVQSRWFNDITGTGGLVKTGDGLLMMFGNSTYSGKTRIYGGILALAGSIGSDTSIQSGGILSGDGAIYGNVDNHGTIYGGWGADGGTLTIDGNYHQAADAAMRVKIGAAEGTSRVDISGTAELAGGTVDAFLNPGTYRGDARYTILASGGLTGKFDKVQADYAFLDLTLGYDANNTYLNVIRNKTAFAEVGLTKNQRAVGAGAESLDGLALASVPGTQDPSVSIYDLIIGSNAHGARLVFDSLSGEIHSSVKSALLDESRFARDVVSGRLRAASGSAMAPVLPLLGYGSNGQVSVAADASSALWGQAYGSWGHLSSGSNVAKLERSSGGFYIGADGEFGRSWRAGFAGGYGNTSLDAKGRASSASVDSYTVAAYAGTEIDALAFRFGAAHTWHRVETDRATAFGPSAADYDARTAQVFGEAGYAFNYNGVVFEPFANLAYANLHTDGIGESGAARLKSQSDTDDNVFTTMGLRVQTDVPVGDKAKLMARGMLGWQHAFGDTSPDTTFAFSGGAPFSIEGTPIARNAFVTEVGLEFSMTKKVTLGVSYTGQMSAKAQAHGLRGDLSWKF